MSGEKTGLLEFDGGMSHEILITPYGVDESIANGIIVIGKQ